MWGSDECALAFNLRSIFQTWGWDHFQSVIIRRSKWPCLVLGVLSVAGVHFGVSSRGKEVKRQKWSYLSGVCGLSGRPDRPRSICDTNQQECNGTCCEQFLWGSHWLWANLSLCLEPKTTKCFLTKWVKGTSFSRLGDCGEKKKKELNESSKIQSKCTLEPTVTFWFPVFCFSQDFLRFYLSWVLSLIKIKQEAFPFVI